MDFLGIFFKGQPCIFKNFIMDQKLIFLNIFLKVKPWFSSIFFKIKQRFNLFVQGLNVDFLITFQGPDENFLKHSLTTCAFFSWLFEHVFFKDQTYFFLKKFPGTKIEYSKYFPRTKPGFLKYFFLNFLGTEGGFSYTSLKDHTRISSKCIFKIKRVRIFFSGRNVKYLKYIFKDQM